MKDFITELEYFKPQTKTFLSDGGMLPSSNANRCRLLMHPINSFDDMVEFLERTRKKSNSTLVRGLPRDLDQLGEVVDYGLCSLKEWVEGHYWCYWDFDKKPLPEWLWGAEWAVKVQWVVEEYLGEPFATSSYYYQLSSSAGMKEGIISVHVWFWMSERIEDKFGQFWAKKLGLDEKSFVRIQKIYVADPVFEEGRIDPVGDARTGVRLVGKGKGRRTTTRISVGGLRDEYRRLNIATIKQKLLRNVRSAGYVDDGRPRAGKFKQHLECIGYDKVNTPVWTAMMSWISLTGPLSDYLELERLIWEQIQSSPRAGDYRDRSWLKTKLDEARAIAQHRSCGPSRPLGY